LGTREPHDFLDASRFGLRVRGQYAGDEKFWRCRDGSLNWPSAMNKRFPGVLLSLSAFSIAGIMFAADGLDDPVCRVFLDAMSKSARTPVHAYITMGSLTNGTAPTEIETLTIGDVAYTKSRGEWKVGKARSLVAEFMEQMTLHPEATIHCEYERDEPFESEAATVYRIRVGKVDCKMWVSKARGLMVHATIDIPLNGSVTHASVRYDYTNVQAPVGALDAHKR
jgi:hypothetical protein